MGLFESKSVFSRKIVTAEITDAGNQKYFVPIKTVLGDYFVCKINEQTYAFKIGTVKTTKQWGVFAFQSIDYDVTHYMPITNETKLIELVQAINGIPKINNKLLGILKVLGRTEKKEFTAHNLPELAAALKTKESKYKDQIQKMIEYFDSLNIQQIVTPLGRLTDFLEEDLKTTDAKFMGSIFDKAVEVDKEHKTVLNKPVNAKKSIAMMIMIPMMICLVGTTLYFAYEAGTFDNLGSGIGGAFTGGANEQDIMNKYPNAAALKVAVDSGKLKYETLPPGAKKMYDSLGKK